MGEGGRRPGEGKKGIDYIGITCTAIVHDGNGKFAMHKRSKNARDEHGNWDIAAGGLDFGERLEECITREIKEEYCADVLELKQLGTFTALREQNGIPTHWVGRFFATKVDPKQVKIGEPHKMDDLGWFTLDTLPSPLHSQFPKVKEKIKQFFAKKNAS